jgi:hypothetical protein
MQDIHVSKTFDKKTVIEQRVCNCRVMQCYAENRVHFLGDPTGQEWQM